MKSLTEAAKKTIVEKALNRKDQTLTEIAKLNNVAISSLARWIKQYKGESVSTKPLSREKRFEHLMVSANLDEVALGAYCRKHGLYSFQLDEWKKEFLNNDSDSKKSKESAELHSLKAENNSLKKDLLRKDRALAETTALLVLKKKADLLFGGQEDD